MPQEPILYDDGRECAWSHFSHVMLGLTNQFDRPTKIDPYFHGPQVAVTGKYQGEARSSEPRGERVPVMK